MNMGTKVCKKCLIEKSLDDFYNEKRNLDGLMGACKDCYNSNQKKWSKNNPDKVMKRHRTYYENNKEKVLSYFEKYRNENRENILTRATEYRNNNREKIREDLRLWKKNNPDKVVKSRKQQGERNKIDIIFNLKNRMRCRLYHFLSVKNITKKSKTFEIVGCSPEFLKEHLEKQFKEGMCWENRSEWHIDHIIPLSLAKTEEEIYQLSHYTNLQPLWVGDNLKKGNKILKTI
jgi:5-methylcytosine-specific restriction endonuclease McrA